jgi:hypothetical protein
LPALKVGYRFSEPALAAALDDGSMRRFQPLVTSPCHFGAGRKTLESKYRTPCYFAAADSGADATRSQRRADCARMRSRSSGNR